MGAQFSYSSLFAQLLLFLLFHLHECSRIHIFGPGVQNPELAFPSRYFFVLHREPIHIVRLVSTCQLWTQTFNETQFCVEIPQEFRFDESEVNFQELLHNAQFCTDVNSEVENSTRTFHVSIVRYKLLEAICDNGLTVQIEGRDRRLLLTQRIETKFVSEFCDCPNTQWSEKAGCSSSESNRRLHEQIDRDLEPFRESGIDFDRVLEGVEKEFAPHERTYAVCLYQIIAGKLYRKCYGEYVGFNKFFDEILLSLLRKHSLRDTEFIVNLGDWPLALKNRKGDALKLPILSWCGSEDSYDIVLPTYELTESILHSQGRILTDILSVFQQRKSFASKEARLFWRGRDSHRARLKLFELAQASPHLYNVSITNFFFFRDEMSKYTESDRPSRSTHVPFADFFNFKYQINIDGTVAAYRFPFLLAGNSLVFKQNSDYYEFFYKLLVPNRHYVPVTPNLEDLTELLEQFQRSSTPEKELEMIWNARKFVLSHLLPENVFCYYLNVLNSYTELLSQPRIELRAGCELVELEHLGDDAGGSSRFDLSACRCSFEDSDSSLKSEL